MKKSKSNVPEGTIRIKVKNNVPVIKTKTSWKKTVFDTTNLKKIIQAYKKAKKEKILLDTKDKTFYKGFITPEGNIRGEKISKLPSGEELEKPFSLLAPHVTLHDDKTHGHWDVMFQNPNKTYAYIYTKEKRNKAKKKKFSHVKDFKKRLPKLRKNLNKALEKGELMALPIYTLLKTGIRVGNEQSYKNYKHKGLTTLKKEDVTINKSKVNFTFVGKDGVPHNKNEIFAPHYAEKLVELVEGRKRDDFIFTNKNGKVLKDTHFEKAFEQYAGKRFYPHIVRSFYATVSVEQFLKKNKHPTKQEVKELYNKIAEKLGHKKFSKKSGEWHPSYTVTIAHYIDPVLIAKINRIVVQ